MENRQKASTPSFQREEEDATLKNIRRVQRMHLGYLSIGLGQLLPNLVRDRRSYLVYLIVVVSDQ